MDQLTPLPPRRRDPSKSDPPMGRTAELLGCDGPTELGLSVRVDGNLPKGLECVDAFPLYGILCSPFHHVAFIHVSL